MGTKDRPFGFGTDADDSGGAKVNPSSTPPKLDVDKDADADTKNYGRDIGGNLPLSARGRAEVLDRERKAGVTSKESEEAEKSEDTRKLEALGDAYTRALEGFRGDEARKIAEDLKPLLTAAGATDEAHAVVIGHVRLFVGKSMVVGADGKEKETDVIDRRPLLTPASADAQGGPAGRGPGQNRPVN